MRNIPTQVLSSIARQHGTPTYAYDIAGIVKQVARLRSRLPKSVQLQYSLKANPSLGICALLAKLGLGADVASDGELITALEAGFLPERIVAGGPYKSPQTIELLRSLPDTMISIDSVSELKSIIDSEVANPILLRLRPHRSSCSCEDTGFQSRFGIRLEELACCRDYIAQRQVHLVGFHVFSGCQVLCPQDIVRDLRAALDLSLEAACTLGVSPAKYNLGGGFGVPYSNCDLPVALGPISEELKELAHRAPTAQLVLELGRYFVAESGWYLTRVVANQTNGSRRAVVVDGGTHQRNDLCRLGLSERVPPVVVAEMASEAPNLAETDVLGCLCLPDDVLARGAQLPGLHVGDLLGFPIAGAYGMTASPIRFLGHPAPAEVAFAGTAIKVLRSRERAKAVLQAQSHLDDRTSSTWNERLDFLVKEFYDAASR
jgi:diaminopimelate decarboxylase